MACWQLILFQVHALTSVAELQPQIAAKSLATKPRALVCQGPPLLNRREPANYTKINFATN